MTITINLTSLAVTKDGVDLGHVCDAILNDPASAAEAKAALDLAWIAKQAQINAHATTIIALQAQLAG